MIKKNQFSFLFFTLFIFVFGWGEEPLHLSLKEAENIALQNNYALNASLHALEQGYYGYKASQGNFLPQVIGTGSYNVGKGEDTLNGVIQITQPLYNKVSSYQIQESQIQWEILKVKVQQLVADLLFQVRDGYYTILLNQAHLAVDRAIIELWEKELKRQERFFELGSAIHFDLNQARLHLRDAWSEYYDSEGEIKSSKIKLLTILGLPPETHFVTTEREIPLPPFDWKREGLKEWKQKALEYSPQLKQMQFSYLLSKNAVNQTKAERLPTVAVYANGGNQYVNYKFSGQPYCETGVNVSWMLYDPTNKPRVKQAEEGRREAISNYYQAELESNAAIYSLLNEIEQSYLSYQNAQEGAHLAEQGMEMAMRKHQLGMMSSFEYRDVIKTLHESQQDVHQAKFDLHNAYDRLIQQTGLDFKR